MAAPKSGPRSGDRFSQLVASRARGLSPALRSVITYFDANRSEALAKSAMELAAQIGTSDATVIRAAQALGFGGLKELKSAIAESLGSGERPSDNLVRTLREINGNASVAASQVIRDHIAAMEPFLAGDRHRELLTAIDLLSKQEKLAIFGLGPSAHVAEYFRLMISRMGRSTISITAGGKQVADQLLSLDTVGAVIILSYDKIYPEARAAMETAKALQLPVVLVTDTQEQGLLKQATAIIRIPRGRAKHIALHGATLATLDAVLLGVAAHDASKAIASLRKLDSLRDLARSKR